MSILILLPSFWIRWVNDDAGSLAQITKLNWNLSQPSLLQWTFVCVWPFRIALRISWFWLYTHTTDPPYTLESWCVYNPEPLHLTRYLCGELEKSSSMGSTMPEKPIGIQLRKILAAVKNRCVSLSLFFLLGFWMNCVLSTYQHLRSWVPAPLWFSQLEWGLQLKPWCY